MADKPDQPGASMIRNLEEKTGKSPEARVKVARSLGWLKDACEGA